MLPLGARACHLGRWRRRLASAHSGVSRCLHRRNVQLSRISRAHQQSVRVQVDGTHNRIICDVLAVLPVHALAGQRQLALGGSR